MLLYCYARSVDDVEIDALSKSIKHVITFISKQLMTATLNVFKGLQVYPVNTNDAKCFEMSGTKLILRCLISIIQNIKKLYSYECLVKFKKLRPASYHTNGSYVILMQPAKWQKHFLASIALKLSILLYPEII